MEERINDAIEVAWRYGQIDGAHHKMWVIDKMVRILLGSEDDYKDWVEAYEAPLNDGDYYEWNTGIAP